MSGAVALAISTQASVQAAIAAEQAHKAHVAACAASMPTFADAGATLEAKRSYAECVGFMYPAPDVSDGERYVIKGVIALVFIGIVAGIIACKRDRYGGNDVSDYVMYALGGGVLLPIAAGIVGALVAGAIYLLT